MIGAWGVVLIIPLAIAVGIVDAATHSRATAWLAYLAILILVGSVTSAASRVFSVALYRYATGSGTTGPFAEADLRQPFRKRLPNNSTNAETARTAGDTAGTAVQHAARSRRLRLILLVGGLILVGGVFIANVVMNGQHSHHSTAHQGPDHGVVFGLIVIVGLLLLLASGVVHLWIKRRERAR